MTMKMRHAQGPSAGLMLYFPGTILVAKPLNELCAHIKDFKIPPVRLVARTIKTLVFFVFRRHLCDGVLIAKKEGIFHSLRGRLEKVSLHGLAKSHPKLFKSCFVLVYNQKAKPDFTKPEQHPYVDHDLGRQCFGRDANLSGYMKITPQTILYYYRNFYGINLSTRHFVSISDLFNSSYLDNETNNGKIRDHFKQSYDINTEGYR